MSSETSVPESEKQPRSRRWAPSEALVLAITPALAYAVAFQVEKGRAGHFGYPADWIRIELSDVLLTWVWLIVVGWMGVTIVTIWISFLPARATRVLSSFVWRPTFLLAGAVTMIRERDHFGLLGVIVGAFIGVATIALLFYEVISAFRNRQASDGVLDFIERYNRAQAPATSDAPHLPWRSLGDHPPVGIASALMVLGLLAIVIVFGVPELLGGFRAGRPNDFATLPGPPRYVLLKRYSDTHVAQELDSTGEFLEPVFKLIPMGDSLLARIEIRHFQQLAIRARRPSQPIQVRTPPGGATKSPQDTASPDSGRARTTSPPAGDSQ